VTSVAVVTTEQRKARLIPATVPHPLSEGGRETVLISLLVLLETEWVLRSRYNVAKAEIVAALLSS
jgi:hypothetical protein